MGNDIGKNVSQPHCAILADPSEQSNKLLHLTYFSVRDAYTRHVIPSEDEGWKCLIYEFENVERSIVPPSNTSAYFVAPDIHKRGTMKWRFEAGEGYKFTHVFIRADFLVTVPNRGISWYMTSPDPLEDDGTEWTKNIGLGMKKGEQELSVDLDGKPSVSVTCSFGPEDKRHPGEEPFIRQVFRENDSSTAPPLEIKLTIAEI